MAPILTAKAAARKHKIERDPETGEVGRPSITDLSGVPLTEPATDDSLSGTPNSKLFLDGSASLRLSLRRFVRLSVFSVYRNTRLSGPRLGSACDCSFGGACGSTGKHGL